MARSFVMMAVVLAEFALAAAATAAAYDPLAVGTETPEQKDFDVVDSKRSRTIPIRVYLPQSKSPADVIVFSHGLGGSRANNPYLGNHWARRGYVCVFLQHPASDEGVWKDKPLGQRMGAMQQAAGLENFQLRVKDVPAVLDQLEAWNDETSHPLAGRINLKHIGMSGHSFGAVTTQAVSGQSFPLGMRFNDTRIKAAVLMSPSIPKAGDVKKTFADVKIPWLLMTGTKDTAFVGNSTAESRLEVYPALPAGSKYEVNFDKAEHSAFSDRALPGDTEKRNPNHHRAILALTTAFWDAYLRDDAEAKAWLDGEGAKGMLEPKDTWRRK